MADELDDLSFEDAMAQLEALVEELEGGKVGLEQMVELCEKGSILHRLCDARLKDAEMRIAKINEAGEEEPFDPEAEDGA